MLYKSQLFYTGKIVNWNQVGGENKSIIALQRAEGSGSQTVMLSFMNGTQMAKSSQSFIGRKIGYSILCRKYCK